MDKQAPIEEMCVAGSMKESIGRTQRWWMVAQGDK